MFWPTHNDNSRLRSLEPQRPSSGPDEPIKKTVNLAEDLTWLLSQVLVKSRKTASSWQFYITIGSNSGLAVTVDSSVARRCNGVYVVVKELSWFDDLCTWITSRISTSPSDCKYLDVPALSMNVACGAFRCIYDSNNWSDLVNDILEQLDSHPLPITLLATLARQNKWGMNRLATGLGQRRTSVLQTERHGSLTTAIELSLASPLFQGLGPDARAPLGVVAFFSQGIDENNLDGCSP